VKKNIILIDFENVQPRDLGQLRGRPFTTRIFCGANQSKLPLDFVAELQPFGRDVEYLRIQGAGHNALDFHIAYYIGRLSVENPGVKFYVISKDKGFDPLVAHLKTQGVACERLDALKEVPGVGAAAPKSPMEKLKKVAETLLKQKEAKPRRVKALTASIKAQLGEQATEANIGAVIARLTWSGVQLLPDGKVTYPAE